MINPLQEKKMLIESMKRLVSHVASNPQRQAQIFNALSPQDLNKIITNLRDDNEYLRRISALLLCEMFFLNEGTKQKAIQLLALSPSTGRICLGGIPQSIGKYPSTLKRCIELVKQPLEEGQEDKMCWIINLERKLLRLQTMDYKKFSSFTFIDPHKNIFGFTVRPRRSPSPRMVEVGTPKQGRLVQTMYEPNYAPHTPVSPQTNAQFYRHCVDSTKKVYQSKRSSVQEQQHLSSSFRNRADRPAQSKPNTPHISVTLTPNPKRQSLRSSLDYGVKYNPNLTMTAGRNNINMEKLAHSTHIPGHYSKIATTLGRPEPGDAPEMRQRGARVMSGKEGSGGDRHGDRFYNRMKEVLHK